MSDRDDTTLAERVISAFHGIEPPSAAARRLAGALDASVAAHHRLRAAPPLEQPPADFAATLLALADPPLPAAAAAASPLDGSGLAGLRDALRGRSLSSVDALAACLERIDRDGPRFNAVLWQQRERAFQDARDADLAARNATAVRGRLHGVPLAHKDLFARHGTPLTAGSEVWRHHLATTTATVIARLRDAGSYAFAGLHTADFAQNPTGHNAAYGDAINPWDPTRITGGSSSGAGIAVARGYTTAALGTDTGGSIRLPAACCGITGLKPTTGLVSRAGVVPLCASLDCVGPLARTALDCAILLDIVAGPDPADPTASRRDVADHEAALTGEIQGQRIGVPVHGFIDDDAVDIHAAFHAAIARLRALGAIIVPVQPPLLDEIVTYGGTVARAEAAALHEAWMRISPSRFAPHVAARLYPGYAIPATFYIEAIQRRPAILDQFCRTLFDRIDVLATPTLRGPTPTRAETDMDGSRPGSEDRFFWVGDNVRPFNYLGLPALSLPCGFDRNHMPVGLQLIGRPYAEPRLLRIADAYQRATGAPPLPPP